MNNAVDSEGFGKNPSGAKPSIAFYPFRGELRFPRNNREYYLSRELASRGWNVSWLRPRDGDNSGVEVEWPIIRLPELDYRGRRFFYPLYLSVRLWTADVDVLWLSGWTIRNLQEVHWTIRSARALGLHVIYDPIDPICEYRDSMREDDDPGALRRCREKARKLYSACDLVTLITPQIKERLVNHGAPADRMMVARWGTDAELFDPESVHCDLKEQLGLSPETFLVGWLGTMSPFKGLLDIFLPLAKTVSEARSDVHFVLAGKGRLMSKIETWANEHPEVALTVLSRIPYEDAPNFTGSLDAYLVPTARESQYGDCACPVKCFDALAMGTPLIATRTPATNFLEDVGNQVSLVDYDLAAFQEALMEIYHDNGKASPARDAVEAEYSHQAVSVSLADAIEKKVLSRVTGDQ